MSCSPPVTGDVRVTGLINQDNNLALTDKDIGFQEPVVVTDAAYNTSVEVFGQPDFTHSGKVEVHYTRLDLAQLFADFDPVELIVSGQPELGDIVCGLNAEYGTSFATDEFTITAADEDMVLLSAKPTSLAYIGTVALRLTQQRVHLDERMTVNQLDGFGYPADRNGTLDKPKLMIDTPSTWATAADDNGWGYDIVSNGELELSARVWWSQLKQYTPRQRQGNGILPDGTRNAFCWGYNNGGTINPNLPWTQRFAVRMGNKTIREIMELYKITLHSLSRMDSSSPWTAQRTGLFTLTIGATGNPYWVESGTKVVNEQAPQDAEGWCVFNSANSPSWFYKGLVPGVGSTLVGDVQFTMTATRKDGQGVPMVLKSFFQTIALPSNDPNPAYTLTPPK